MALAAAMLAMLAALAFCLVVTRQAPRTGQAITVSPKVTVRAVKPVVEEQKLVPLAPEAARAFNAERPVAAGPPVAARPYVLTGAPEDRMRATDCLAAAGWYEIGDDARGQPAVIQGEHRLPVHLYLRWIAAAPRAVAGRLGTRQGHRGGGAGRRGR